MEEITNKLWFKTNQGIDTTATTFDQTAFNDSKYFEHFLTKDDNFKEVITRLETLTNDEKNEVFEMHNEAMNGMVYGIGLVKKLFELLYLSKISSDDVDKMYILSIDWPYQVKIDKLK